MKVFLTGKLFIKDITLCYEQETSANNWQVYWLKFKLKRFLRQDINYPMFWQQKTVIPLKRSLYINQSKQ